MQGFASFWPHALYAYVGGVGLAEVWFALHDTKRFSSLSPDCG